MISGAILSPQNVPFKKYYQTTENNPFLNSLSSSWATQLNLESVGLSKFIFTITLFNGCGRYIHCSHLVLSVSTFQVQPSTNCHRLFYSMVYSLCLARLDSAQLNSPRLHHNQSQLYNYCSAAASVAATVLVSRAEM